MSAEVIVLLVIVGFLCLLLWGADICEKNLQEEAVKRGYAVWEVINKRTGKTEFRWLDKPSTPSPETVIPPQPADQ